MPQALPIILEAAGDAAVAAFSATGSLLVANIAFYGVEAALYVAGIAGLEAISSALVTTPKPQNQKLTERQTLPPRYRGCGHTRMGGAILLDYASNQDLRKVIAFADCYCGNVDGIWMNQDRVTLKEYDAGKGYHLNTTSGGSTTGAYSRVWVDWAFGAPGVWIFSYLGYPNVWPSTSSANGVFCGLINTSNGKTDDFGAQFPRGPDLQLNVAADLDLHYDWRDGSQSLSDRGTWKNSANPVVCLVNELFRNRGYDWATDFEPTLSILTAEANACDVPVPVLNNLTSFSDDFPAGGAGIRLVNVTGIVAGTVLTIGGQTYTVASIGSVVADGTNVNLTTELSTDAGAGSLVRWVSNPASPTTAPTYAAHGRWVCGETESDTVKRFMECMDGYMARRSQDGAVVILSGRYVAPANTVGLDEIVDYTWASYVGLGKVINQLVPTYVEPANNYNQTDGQPWDDTGSQATDGLSSKSFTPGLVQSYSQVRRLCKARMAREQYPQQQLVLKASAIARFLGQRFLLLPTAGMEVSEMNGLVLEVVGNPEIIDNGLHVSFPVKRFDPACYDWDYLTEEGSGPADLAFPIAQVLPTPTITGTSLVFQPVATGQAGVRISVNASGPDRDDLTWSVRTRVTGSVSWDEQTDRSLVGGTVTILSDFVPADQTIDVEVAYSIGAGTLSTWSDTTEVSTATYTTVPDPAGEVSLTNWTDTLLMGCATIPRAQAYQWSVYKADGTTLLHQATTQAAQYGYTATQAALDGAQREYKLGVQGVNNAGAGTISATLLDVTLAAPAALTGVSASGGAYDGEVTATASTATLLAGYLVVVSTTSGFDPMTAGTPILYGSLPAVLSGLAAGTWYAQVAAIDLWTASPSLLNMSGEVNFTITTGGGPSPTGGASGAGRGAAADRLTSSGKYQ